MKNFLMLSLLLCLFVQVGCTKNNETNPQAAREPEKKFTDSDLKNEIQTKINSDAALRNDSLSISADADRNRATLSGTVESEALRTRALELARAAHSGLSIED